MATPYVEDQPGVTRQQHTEALRTLPLVRRSCELNVAVYVEEASGCLYLGSPWGRMVRHTKPRAQPHNKTTFPSF